jgi:hypothetical protein
MVHRQFRSSRNSDGEAVSVSCEMRAPASAILTIALRANDAPMMRWLICREVLYTPAS